MCVLSIYLFLTTLPRGVDGAPHPRAMGQQSYMVSKSMTNPHMKNQPNSDRKESPIMNPIKANAFEYRFD